MEWKKSQKKIFTVFLCMFIAVLCAGCLKKEETVAEQDTEVQKKNKEQIQEKTEEKKPEDEIYSYLQGIKSYEKGKEWSGEWCYEEANDNRVSGRGGWMGKRNPLKY